MKKQDLIKLVEERIAMFQSFVANDDVHIADCKRKKISPITYECVKSVEQLSIENFKDIIKAIEKLECCDND